MDKTWIELVRQKMQEMKLKQEDIAEKMGKTQGAIGHWLTGRRSPKLEEIAQMLKIVGIDKVILNSDASFTELEVHSSTLPSDKAFNYPVINALNEESIYLDSELDIGKKGFFIRVADLSMQPVFNCGDLVLIDPNKQPKPSNFVVAKTETGELVFKRYRELNELSEKGNPHFELVPLNLDFPTLTSKNQRYEVLGVAVEHRSYF